MQRRPAAGGVYLLCRNIGDQVEFLTMTMWDSIESVKGFAGEDHMKARYYPEDESFLTVFSPLVDHFEVVVGAEGDRRK